MALQDRIKRYRSQGAGLGLVRVEVLVPPEGRAAILQEAARLRNQRREASPESLSKIYNEAMERFGARCLWNATPSRTPEGLLLVADRLRRYGGMDAWRLATQIRDEVKRHADR
jgi:hypothetical protein